MAPTTALAVEWQTEQIIKCLFEDDITCRSLSCEGLEVDSARNDEDTFDPVQAAETLKRVGDAMKDDVEFKAALAGLKQAVAEEAMDMVFSRGVDAICKTHVCQQPEVSSEMQLINASVAFGLYLQKSSPQLETKIRRAMVAFITSRVGVWLFQQGGWGNVV
ncbi:hypothetical protein VZT92_013363 [Zoarces viviparus]|uniref:Bcl-2-like protein 15 n=1 Tax=Zoarces viviparus TaxID=48416 RepID=A0AAW1F4D5_ZOAVI